MYVDYKRSYKNRSIFRFLYAFILVSVQSIFFYFMWVYYYNTMQREYYLFKGNIFVSIIYAFLYTVFLIALDSARIGDNKLSNVIFTGTLTVIFTNICTYMMILMPAYAKGFVNAYPLIITSLRQFLYMTFISILANMIYKKMYPAMPMLLISNENSMEDILIKLQDRKDIYNTVEKISSDKPFNEIKDKCLKFTNVLVGDIEAQKRNDIVKFCFENSINIFVMPKLSDIIIKNSTTIYTLDTPIYQSANEGLSFGDAVVKRFLDIICSFLGIIILMPLFVIISILIKSEDKGPILFVQERITKDNKIFNIYKFRSMRVGQKNGVHPTCKNDERVTKIGNFIRQTHIDELPQLFNVLKGDMSIVGPRPERKEHVELYSKQIVEFQYRLKVKAGLTGLAQVYGRYNTTAYDKLKLDLIYIKNYSLLLDIELVLKTLKVLIMKENTEGFNKKQSEYIEKNTN